MASQIETPIAYTRHTTPQFIWWQQQKCSALGGSPDGMQSDWRTL